MHEYHRHLLGTLRHLEVYHRVVAMQRLSCLVHLRPAVERLRVELTLTLNHLSTHGEPSLFLNYERL